MKRKIADGFFQAIAVLLLNRLGASHRAIVQFVVRTSVLTNGVHYLSVPYYLSDAKVQELCNKIQNFTIIG
jgi:hypothetical protein